MLKLISLFFIGIFIVSCGGEVSTVYYNNNNLPKNTNTNTNNTNTNANTNTNNTNNTNDKDINCIPGVECDKKQSPDKVETSSFCLPGVNCLKVDNNNEVSDTDTSSNDTNKLSSDIKKSCLPGVKC